MGAWHLLHQQLLEDLQGEVICLSPGECKAIKPFGLRHHGLSATVFGYTDPPVLRLLFVPTSGDRQSRTDPLISNHCSPEAPGTQARDGLLDCAFFSRKAGSPTATAETTFIDRTS
ncbi:MULTISPECIES: hypothetical protein [Pseudomonas syringae group]|uniref:Uncharacterized protein n=1 Tax=Pseudomonas serbiensis TaxID=3064350 RepID=A0ABT9CZ40_9PSED|nr:MULTISPECIES: hypothetical protein [Pseudomonas]MDO7929210.1 hypothetical protein [Pseudomonas sp. KFB-138]